MRVTNDLRPGSGNHRIAMAAHRTQGRCWPSIDKHGATQACAYSTATGRNITFASGQETVEKHIRRTTDDGIDPMPWNRTGRWIADAGGGFPDIGASLIDLHLTAAIQARGETDLTLETLDLQ